MSLIRIRTNTRADDVARISCADPFAPLAVDLEHAGGLIADATALYCVIRAHRGPTSVFVRNNCDSAGVLALIAFDRRTCTPWASFLFHDVRIKRSDLVECAYTAQDLRKAVHEMEDVEAKFVALLGERTCEREDFWRGLFMPDPGWPVCAHQALKSGLVHDIERPRS